MIYTSKKIIIFLFTIMQLAILSSCMDSGYRLSFPEIDDLADEYPAQAKVFLSRADSNDNKGYYKLLTAKIEYQLNGYIYKENDIDDAINIFVNEKDDFLACINHIVIVKLSTLHLLFQKSFCKSTINCR
jgi:hypothetical protein